MNNKKLYHKKYWKQYYKKHKEEIKCKRKQCYQKNRQKEIERVLEYNKKHKEWHRQHKQKYYKRHKKEILLNVKKYAITHKKEKRKYNKVYYKLHEDKLHQNNQKYRNIRRKKDTIFKLLDNLRRRVNIALKQNYKSSSTIKLLGCSIEFLKQHLESQFRKGMAWKNWSRKGWHIDHIKPCAYFDLSKVSEQRNCFNYKNLQPLWAEENLRKGSK